ncbi:MAG TPA: spore germination protein GerW family protein [Methanobacteriaceae archaeon]|nr:spore germination protein GerW family protein [Methanobacteriaceae archaeon]
MDIQDPIKTTVEEIRKVLSIENVIGEVIETEDKVMIPVTKFGMAFGAGMGEGQGPTGQGGGKGAGAGGGAGIEPVAMVVVFKGVAGHEGVKIMSLKSADPLVRAVSEVGTTIVDIMKEGRKSGMGMHGKKHKKGHKMHEEPSEEKPSEEKKE